MMHKAWCHVEEVPYNFSRSSIKFQGHTGWKINDFNPILVRLLGRSQLSNPSDLPCFHNFSLRCSTCSGPTMGYCVLNVSNNPYWSLPGTDCPVALISAWLEINCKKFRLRSWQCWLTWARSGSVIPIDHQPSLTKLDLMVKWYHIALLSYYCGQPASWPASGPFG